MSFQGAWLAESGAARSFLAAELSGPNIDLISWLADG